MTSTFSPARHWSPPELGGSQIWTIVLNNDREFIVVAESIQRTSESDALAFNDEDAYAWDPSAAWRFAPANSVYFFTTSRKVQLMGKVTRSRGRTKRPDAQAALRMWQAEQNTKPAAMYGRVLQEDANLASGKDGSLYVYERGLYVPAETYVIARLQDLAGDQWSRHLHNETLAWLVGCSPGLDDNLGPDIINVRNGLLILSKDKWRLRPHDPEVRTTVQLPVTFEKEATCPLYDRLLETSLPDEHTRQFVDEWSGYNLTSDYAHQKALMLGGEAGSGKSQYLHVLGELLGKRNLTAATLQALSENRFAAADVYGKLANICADISSHELRMTGIFKQLTGGDVIRAEKKHRDAFEFTNVAKLSFSANEIPATRDASSAFFDRWIVLRFPTRFRGTSAEHKNLGRQIAANPAEMSGVLNRALRGLTRLRRTGHFTVGRAMRDAQAEFRREADTVALFLEDQVPSERSARFEQGRTFYEQYRAWCDANGHQALSSHRLYRRLRDWSPTDELAVRHTKSQGSSYFTIDRQGS